jgi:glycosyltransferase involved in cell wall biosynthesis
MSHSTSDLVSVVIPTFNRAKMVVEAIDSVLRQRDCSFEIIVVDDGSTDTTRSLLSARESELRYLHQPRRGVAAARNLGARHARGGWLAFLDSDDLWRPRKLALQLAFHHAAPHVPISQTEEIWVRDGRRVNPCAHHRKPEGDIFIPSLARCLVSPSAVMLRRELFSAAGGFDETLPVCEDYDLWLRIASRVPVGLIAEPLVVKRGGHADQLSRQFWGMDRFRVAAMLKVLAAGAVSGERRRALAAELTRKCTILAQGARRRRRIDEARRYELLAQVG